MNDADKRDLIDPEALRAELSRFCGDPGIRPLRHLLDKLFFRLSDSELVRTIAMLRRRIRF